MQIGVFVRKAGTTKDTIRHYEDLQLIVSKQSDGRRRYTDKHLEDFAVIQELKGCGLSLKDIQLIFTMKNHYGCRSEELLREVEDSLKHQLGELEREEQELRNRKELLQTLIQDIAKLHAPIP